MKKPLGSTSPRDTNDEGRERRAAVVRKIRKSRQLVARKSRESQAGRARAGPTNKKGEKVNRRNGGFRSYAEHGMRKVGTEENMRTRPGKRESSLALHAPRNNHPRQYTTVRPEESC